MQREVGLRMLIVVFLLGTFLSGESLAASLNQQDSPQTNVSSPNHGAPEILVEKLIRVRTLEGLLKSISLGDEGRLSADAAESLQTIFARPYDVFGIDTKSGSFRSIREKAFRILKDASPVVQQDWMRATSVLAESRLHDALLLPDQRRLEDVARHFPMTEQGIRAQILSLTREYLQGNINEIKERLALMESDYSGTVLESYFRQQARSLSARLNAAATEPADGASGTASRETVFSISTTAAGDALSPPWPVAKWEWRESVWNYPEAPQPEAGTALESLLPGTASSLNEFSNWRPVFWGDTIVLRSPFRLVAFDRISGQQRWSLPTNTWLPQNEMAEDSAEEPDELMLGFGPRLPESPSIGSLAEFGLLSFDDEYLFFIDQFNLFRRDPVAKRFRLPIFNRNLPRLTPIPDENLPPQSLATRLVALRKSANGGLPEVAWIAGDAQGFRYQAIAPANDDATQSPVINTQDSETDSNNHTRLEPAGSAPELTTSLRDSPSLKGHRFLCPPAGTNQKLFVLTIYNEQFWLNCLSRTAGTLIWQQPLIFSDDIANRDWASWNQSNETSVCVLCDKTVVCSLSEGILIGVRAADGQLSWATAIRNEPLTRLSRGFQLMQPEEVESFDTTTVLVPMASQSIVVCASHPSSGIRGIDSASGEILWTVPRQAFGPGDTGGSPDYYIAGITGTHVVLIGERHCRSLDLKTGDQSWVVGISRTSGRAECRGDRCLIPLEDGQVMTVNLKDGTLLSRRQTFQPENASLLFGSITSDRDVVCVSTPVSLSVYPRVDSFLTEPAPKDIVTQDSVRQILTMARANLINGDSDAAIALLTEAAFDASSATDPTFRESFDHYLAELILQDWGEKFVTSLGRSDDTVFSRIGDSDQAKQLSQLSLSEDQQLRSAVLAILSQPRKEFAQELLQELTKFRGWTSPMPIDENWSVRPDLLLGRSEIHRRPTSDSLFELSPFQVRQLTEAAILFPEMFASNSHRQMFTNRLLTAGEYASAECFLGAWIEMNGPDSKESQQPREMLTQLRERDVIAGYVESEVRKRFRPDDAPDSGSPAKGLTSESSESLVVDFEPVLRNPSWERQLVDKGFPLEVLPDWNPLRYFLIDGRDGFPDLVSMDMSDGSLRDRVTLPFPFFRHGLGFQPTGTDFSVPALIPIAGADQIAMFSCTLPERTKLLWTRRYRDSATNDPEIEFGPLGADHFVWHSQNTLHCSHPATGKDLWTRALRMTQTEKHFSGLRRIFGDRAATIVMGADGSSYERFRTRDGRFLGAGRLTIGRTTDPETAGRYLLYPDLGGRLHLFDGATGDDALENEAPVLLSPFNTRHAFQVLPEGRVVTVSSSLEIILIDTGSGRVIFRTSAQDHVKQIDGLKRVFRMTAFERHGQLYVGLDDEIDNNRTALDGFLRDKEPRINSGPLICLNPVSGDILWSTRLTDAMIPTIYGDPTDLLVTLSHHPDKPDLRRIGRPSLEVQLLSEKTGELITKSPPVSPSGPYRCVHIAASKKIEIISQDSVVSLQAE